MLKPISYSKIMSIADMWINMGGEPKIDLGALEPLLWKDGKYLINDLVSMLTKRNFEVSMTTNGQLLDKFSTKLADAGLSLIRTSWHSTNPLIFKEISGGHGNYDRFINGIISALESGIKIDFNKVLLKGYTNDLPEQLSLIEHYKSRIKLYTLLWTPESDSIYEYSYQGWREVIRDHVLERTIQIKRISKEVGRKKLQFHLKNGGMVEIKLGDMLNRVNFPCSTCVFKEKCEEGFGDYIRIDPYFNMYFCYLRRDFGFPIEEYFKKPNLLKEKIKDKIGHLDINNLLSKTSLRLTLTPFCNFLTDKYS